MKQSIDFNEELALKKYPEVLDVLLIDRSSRKNIKWCTDNYLKYGIKSNDFIEKEQLVFRKTSLIKPRVLKSILEQKRRVKDMAEVFTPSYICNRQNNIIDEQWFGYPNAFNEPYADKWITTKKVEFKNNKKWKDYIDLERIEITCGEAPYLTSRYDATTGSYIEPLNRIGILDRKLRVVTENAISREEWIQWAKIACQRTYGYEWQGDNLLIARQNLLMTFEDFYFEKFNEKCSLELLLEIAEIISWNIWQMDGMKYVVPDSCHEEEAIQLSLFEDIQIKADYCKGCRTGDNRLHNGIYCKIMDWKNKKTLKFIDVISGGLKYAK